MPASILVCLTHGCALCARRPFRRTLRRLEVCGGGLGDAGAAELARLGALEHLSLAHNPRLGDRASLALAGLTGLRSLNLTGTQLTGNGILPLRALTVRHCCRVLPGFCARGSTGRRGALMLVPLCWASAATCPAVAFQTALYLPLQPYMYVSFSDGDTIPVASLCVSLLPCCMHPARRGEVHQQKRSTQLLGHLPEQHALPGQQLADNASRMRRSTFWVLLF